MRLRIKNATHYDRRDLYALIAAGLRALGDDRQYVVTVRYGRGSGLYSSGWAYYNSGTIRLCIPRGKRDMATGRRVPYDEMPADAVTDMARTLAHEIAHTNGVSHAEMNCCHKREHNGGTDNAPVPWAEGLRVRAKAVEPAPIVLIDSVVAERAAHAAAMLSTWERKVKAAKTRCAKWRRKVAYYERKAAAKTK